MSRDFLTLAGISPFPRGDEVAPKALPQEETNAAVEKTEKVSRLSLDQVANFFRAIWRAVKRAVTFKWLKKSSQQQVSEKIQQGFDAIRKGKLDREFSAKDFMRR